MEIIAPHRQKKRRRLSPEDRRDQLLNAAIRAYAEQGVERAGHGDIAKLTNASTATVFNYFPTREALTDAVLKNASERLFAAIDTPILEAERKPSAVLTELLAGLDQLIEREPEIIKVLLNWSVSFGPSVRPQYINFLDQVLTFLHVAIGGNMNSQDKERAEARLIYAAGISYATMKLDKTSAAAIDEFIDRLIGMFE